MTDKEFNKISEMVKNQQRDMLQTMQTDLENLRLLSEDEFDAVTLQIEALEARQSDINDWQGEIDSALEEVESLLEELTDEDD